jgi:undecaprenyl pyrophosphate phosphatase UppP
MKKIFIFVAVSALPYLAFAGSIVDFADNIDQAVNILVPAASMAVTVAFFYGLARFLFNTDDEKKREEGKSILMWSILAMFVFITIYGIIGWMETTIGSDEGPEGPSAIMLPTLDY